MSESSIVIRSYLCTGLIEKSNTDYSSVGNKCYDKFRKSMAPKGIAFGAKSPHDLAVIEPSLQFKLGLI